MLDVCYSTTDYGTLFGHSVQIHKISMVSTGFLYKMMRHSIGIILHSMANFTNIYRLFDYFMQNRPIKYELAPVQGLHLSRVHYNKEY